MEEAEISAPGPQTHLSGQGPGTTSGLLLLDCGQKEQPSLGWTGRGTDSEMQRRTKMGGGGIC